MAQRRESGGSLQLSGIKLLALSIGLQWFLDHEQTEPVSLLMLYRRSALIIEIFTMRRILETSVTMHS